MVALLAALTLLEDFGFLSLVGSQEVADVDDEGLVALHDFHFALQLKLDRLYLIAKTWAPLEFRRKLLCEESADFELWKVDHKLVVVDLDHIEDALEVKLSLSVDHET